LFVWVERKPLEKIEMAANSARPNFQQIASSMRRIVQQKLNAKDNRLSNYSIDALKTKDFANAELVNSVNAVNAKLAELKIANPFQTPTPKLNLRGYQMGFEDRYLSPPKWDLYRKYASDQKVIDLWEKGYNSFVQAPPDWSLFKKNLRDLDEVYVRMMAFIEHRNQIVMKDYMKLRGEQVVFLDILQNFDSLTVEDMMLRFPHYREKLQKDIDDHVFRPEQID